MIEKRSAGDVLLSVVNYTLITIITLLCLYPIIHVLAASFSDPMKLMQHRGVLMWPTGYSLVGYQTVLRNPNIAIGYKNTLIYVICGTAISMALTPLGAYALARKGWPFRRFFVFFFVFTMYFNAGMIPTFMVVRQIGLYDSRLAIILPAAINTWNMIVLRTAFSSLPDELAESAHIDGASDFRILFQIFIPLAQATIAVIVLFYAVDQWNGWFLPKIYLRDTSKYPLQLFVRDMLAFDATGGAVEDANALFLKTLVKYCAIVVTVAPILCIYPFVQKYFVHGIMLGSIKG